MKQYDKVKTLLGTNAYWQHENDIAKLDFDLQCVKMFRKARLSAFLQFEPHLMRCRFLVCRSLMDLLSGFQLQGLTFWPATVMQVQQTHEYYLMYCVPLANDIVNFSKSTFIDGRDEHTFKDTAEMRAFAKDHCFLGAYSIALNDKFDQSMDLFGFESQIFVSSDLKDAIEAAAFTGAYFNPHRRHPFNALDACGRLAPLAPPQ